MRAKTKKWFSPLFVVTLAIAGIFGVSAAVINKQASETPVVEKADAATKEVKYGVFVKSSEQGDTYATLSYSSSTDLWTGSVILNSGTSFYVIGYVEGGYKQAGYCADLQYGRGGLSGVSGISHSTSRGSAIQVTTKSSFSFSVNDNDLASYGDSEWIWETNSMITGTTVYTVSFNANGHGTAPASQDIISGNTASKPSDPTAAGWTFGGWYTEQACQNKWDFSTAVTATKTLYAKWTANTYTLAFDCNSTYGGQGTMTNQSFVYGTAQNIKTSTFTNSDSNKTQTGWNTSADGGGTSFTLGQSLTDAFTSGTHTLYAQWGLTNGYYLYGSFNNWSRTDGLIKLTQDGSNYTASGVTLAANTTLKMVKVENNVFSYDYGVGGGFYTPFPLLYPLNSDGGSNFKVFSAGTYTIRMYNKHDEYENNYCAMSIEPVVSVQYSINGGAKQPMSRTGTSTGGYVAIYSSDSSINPNKDDVITFYVNNTLINSTVPENTKTNSLRGTAGNIYVHNDLLSSQTLIFETTDDGYVAYMGGYRDIVESPYEGITSGSTFFFEDSTSDGWWSGTSAYTFIRFTEPLGHYVDLHEEAWIAVGNTSAGINECSSLVPTLNSENVSWITVDVYRCENNIRPTPGDDDTYWNCVTDKTVDANDINCIEVTNQEAGSLKSYDDPSAGLASGDSLYILDSDNWKSLSGSPNLYCYFFADKNAGETGDAWSGAATVIPYSSTAKGATYYEITIPENNGSAALWKGLILVASTDGTWGGKKQQSDDIVIYSSTKASNQLLTTTGKGDPGSASFTSDFDSEDRADCFAAHFNAVITDDICDNWGTVSNLTALQAQWNAGISSSVRSHFNLMDTRARNCFKNATANPSGSGLEIAASVYDYVIGKYKKTNLPDYASRENGTTVIYSVKTVKPYSLINGENGFDASAILIIVASSISILSITALAVLMVKKKKVANK